MCRVFLCPDCMIGAVCREEGGPVGVRRLTDCSFMFALLDTLLAAECSLLEVKLTTIELIEYNC